MFRSRVARCESLESRLLLAPLAVAEIEPNNATAQLLTGADEYEVTGQAMLEELYPGWWYPDFDNFGVEVAAGDTLIATLTVEEDSDPSADQYGYVCVWTGSAYEGADIGSHPLYGSFGFEVTLAVPAEIDGWCAIYIGGDSDHFPRTEVGNYTLSLSIKHERDIVATSLDWNTSESTIDYTYRVRVEDLQEEATGGLYWSSDDTFDSGDSLAHRFTVNVAQQTYTDSVAASSLENRPAGTTHLLLVVDDGNTIQEADELNPGDFGVNNVEAIPLLDIVAASLDWNTTTLSVNYAYEAKGGDLPGATTGGLYWSRHGGYYLGATLAYSITLESEQQVHEGSVSFAELEECPSDARYLVLVVDPDKGLDETNELNNQVYEKLPTYTVGVVTHGYQIPLVQYASWIDDMADELLITNGYDTVETFHWEVQSSLPTEGVTYAMSLNLLERVNNAVSHLRASKGIVTPVDVHLIGHSRGAIVVGLTAQQLSNPSIGDIKVTMLDPHPARAESEGSQPMYSATSDVSGWLAEKAIDYFHSKCNDPLPYISPNVKSAESYYQHTDITNVSGESVVDNTINLWGESSVTGIPSGRTYSLTHFSKNHSGVHEWYLENVISQPTTASTLMASAAMPQSTTSDDMDAIYPHFVDNRGVANAMVKKLTAARSAYERENYIAARGILGGFVNLVEAQDGKHITAEAADFFVQMGELVIQSIDEDVLSQAAAIVASTSAEKVKGNPILVSQTVDLALMEELD